MCTNSRILLINMSIPKYIQTTETQLIRHILFETDRCLKCKCFFSLLFFERIVFNTENYALFINPKFIVYGIKRTYFDIMYRRKLDEKMPLYTIFFKKKLIFYIQFVHFCDKIPINKFIKIKLPRTNKSNQINRKLCIEDFLSFMAFF